ncbi:MAG: hypothetical protein VX182_04870 [Candidatus Thermoplasmatota archaeon]|uniref:Uncharacterized protein n=2 Tax=Methanobacteriati TaxID=3366610 RepID=B3V6V7_9ARCH|nr:hypothetical protein [uncultured marine group II euryarchaeote AD1000-18-D2]AIE96669.1 hypothetical protein [uncultured marine group II/III euryarchaeote AD1000_86_F07]MEE3319041.1 hypothetical protein [Candidatus Thermoplasmatota archaeon]|tara:strand:+ start:2946 stop:3215 length:270 start_codon:yes stop_codon:yes gene_type:complete
MSKASKGLEEMVDRAMDNPAYDMFGGYHMFLRRVTIPITLILIAMMVYTFLSGYLSDDISLILTALVTGLSVGPIFGLERYFGERRLRK